MSFQTASFSWKRVRALTVSCLVLVAATSSTAGCRTGTEPAEVMMPYEGTWTTVKDGLSRTVAITESEDRKHWIEKRVVDDGNTTMLTAETSYDARRNRWIRIETNAAGVTSTFSGLLDAAGSLVLEQIAHDGEKIETPRSRIVFSVEDSSRFTMAIQSRAVDGSWTGRSAQYTHTRVARPAPPSGEGRIAFISNREGNWEIYSMAPDGSDVINISADSSGDHFPRWVAGGSRLAFRSQRARTDGGWDRWEIDIDGSDASPVDLPGRLASPDAGMFPEVHPSGSYLANAAERNGEQDIYVWRSDGGGERVIAPAIGLDYRPLFAPDGSQILFISERDGDAEVYTASFDGSAVNRLTASPGIDRYARWSPDGRHIGFVSDRDGDLEVFVMAADGTGLRQLTFNDTEDGEISWSPDGRRIAYRSDESGRGEIHVVDVSSGTIVRLTNNDAYDGEPVWSPPPLKFDAP